MNCHVASKAQAPILGQTYSFSKDSYTLYELSAVLQRQADISISFDAQKLKSNTKIKLPKRSINAKELTTLLNKQYQIQSKFIGRHIIWQKDDKAPVPPKKAKSKKQNIAKKNSPKPKVKKDENNNTSTIAQAPNPMPTLILVESMLDTIVAFKDTFSANASSIAGYGWQSDNNTSSDGIAYKPNTASDSIRERLDQPQVTNTSNSWYQRFGISAQVQTDEFLFFNPGLTLHWSNFSVTANYAIKSGLSHFRFGLAYQQPLSDALSLSIWANYGNLPLQSRIKNYAYDSITGTPPDSLFTFRIEGSVPYSLEASLAKAGLNIDWKVGQHMELFAGLSFNRLRTTYFHNNIEQAPRTFIPEKAAIETSEFQILPSVITLSDNFESNLSNNVRAWIGFQVGLRIYVFKSKNKYE